jgi:cardiolipin synthase A/B
VRGTVARLASALSCAVLTAVLCTFGTGSPASATIGMHRESGLVGVLVEPSKLGSTAGMEPVYSFVLSARRSVDMTMYEFIDPTMVKDLVADHKRGVRVRVILDTNRERSRNLATFRALRAGGVAVVWADTRYEATHQKTITVDGRESLIASFNLTEEYYSTTRDFGIWDTDRADVAAIEAVFDADFAHRPITPSDGADLVWSPGSQTQMLAVITGAKHTLSIENEEMGDPTITRAVVAAARRGVRVEVTMTASGSYDSDWTSIVHAGGHVHLYANGWTDLYIHAKATIADAGFGTERMYVGSINFSSASMDDNRELGIITTNPAIVDKLSTVVQKDFTDCTATTECRNYS